MRKMSASIDFVMVLIFVTIGRSAHDHGVKLAGVVSTTWPFGVGLAVGWLTLLVRKRTGTSLIDGLTVCSATVFMGMVLRVASGQGTAVAFIFVALAFLGAMMIGWRALFAWLQRARRFRHA
jgi:hypothetical protein